MAVQVDPLFSLSTFTANHLIDAKKEWMDVLRSKYPSWSDTDWMKGKVASWDVPELCFSISDLERGLKVTVGTGRFMLLGMKYIQVQDLFEDPARW